MRGTRLLAVSKRILRQLARDRRTLALIFVAPVAVLWLVKLLLTTEDYQPRIAVLDNVPAPRMSFTSHKTTTGATRMSATVRGSRVSWRRMRLVTASGRVLLIGRLRSRGNSLPG